MRRIDRISDPYMDLTGFGEGSGSYRMYWYSYEVPESLPFGRDVKANEWFAIECFKLNARELISNIDDLKLTGLLNLSIDRTGEKTRIDSNTFPGKHRAKSLFMDFRHFTLQQDPSNFRTVKNILKKLIPKETGVPDELEIKTNQFINGSRVEVQDDISNDLLELWFYSEYFHRNDAEKLYERESVLRKVYEEDVIHLLVFEVIQRSFAIKSLYAILKDFRHDNRILNLHNPENM